MGKNDWKRVLPRFQKEAGKLLVDKVRDLLGHDDLYTLTPAYAERKRRNPRLRRVAGKDPDQPLILTREGIYDAVEMRIDGQTVVISVNEAKGLSERGYDYAELWQARVDYLGKALDAVEDQFEDLLLDIVFDEMGL